MKLHLSPTEPQISIFSKDVDGNPLKKDVTYESILLTSALISMYHDGAITVTGQDGKPIFDVTVHYHQPKE